MTESRRGIPRSDERSASGAAPGTPAEEIACEAVKIHGAGERSAFLKQACGDDDALLGAVEAIVAECDAMDRILDESGPALTGDIELPHHFANASDRLTEVEPDADEMVGRWVGPYQVRQKIGEGGCGTVYLAEQTRPVRREVALKVIKLGMDTRNVIARFEAERQALVLMNHPNIARALDAGATDRGRPFFVMEVVRGVRITTYCDEQQLGVRPRLELFIQVCHAIQHAHQKGIVHRDLKPSNIPVTMLDDAPVPKVIDFGIAKATGGERLADNTVFTALEQFVGTPAYMSPEQAQMSGVDVDTRSDIYSLGVLLYELLTGQTPFGQAELLRSGLDEMRRTLLEREPHRPSMRLSAMREDELEQTSRCRRVETPRLQSLLQGDLDWIVMKALEKERDRRYQTANGFAMDVQRYLSNEPVLARPPSRWYRLQKLARRNRTTFAAIIAVSVSLLAGLGTSTWLFVLEREARRDADRLRAEADARTKIAQAALLITRQQLTEADQLVDQISIPVAEPSLEAANVFRTLGEWNVTQGRWQAAADRYLQLERANQVDKTNTTQDISRDLLGAGPALVLAGDVETYRRFVRSTLIRFANTSDPLAAEQIIKNSLILPADAATLEHLAPIAKVVEASIANDDLAAEARRGKGRFLSWRALAVALHEYRRGNYANAVAWGEKCLNYAGGTPPRLAMAHLILAMSHARLDRPDNARLALAAGREPVEQMFPAGPGKITDLRHPAGVWHDWVIAYLLLREADGLVK